jgi:putative thioredoxin
MSNSPYIITVTAENFATEVIEKSNQVPVLVDFWAQWCAPCKVLMPILTQLVEEYQGQFILAKLDIDEQQELATEYGIRSVPTLKLFRHGQAVEEMMGAQSETVLRQMIDRHRERPADKLRLQATALQMAGHNEKAISILEQALEMEPNYHPLKLDLAKNLIDLQRFDEAEQLLKELPANVQAETEVNELMAHFMFSSIAAKAPSKETLETTLAKTPDDLMARYQLSARQVLEDDYEAALENLLELMRRNRKFEDDAGRKGILAVFTLLGNQGPVVSRYRGKMAALLY